MRVKLNSLIVSDEAREALRHFLGRSRGVTRHDIRGVLTQLTDAWLDDLVARYHQARLADGIAPDGGEAFPQFREWIESGGDSRD